MTLWKNVSGVFFTQTDSHILQLRDLAICDCLQLWSHERSPTDRATWMNSKSFKILCEKQNYHDTLMTNWMGNNKGPRLSSVKYLKWMRIHRLYLKPPIRPSCDYFLSNLYWALWISLFCFLYSLKSSLLNSSMLRHLSRGIDEV
jgi:hypothetical protein